MTRHQPTRHSTKEMLLLYLQPRQLVVFALGMSQGAPIPLIFSVLTYWLATLHIDKSTGGLFALATLSYSFKFLWAPLLDRVRLPVLANLIGVRRSWLLLLQALLIAAIAALGYSDPANAIGWTALLVVAVGFLSASQDVVIDAFRIEILEDDEQGAGAAMIQYGWRIGAALAAAGALMLAKRIGYPPAYAISGLLILPGLIAVFLWGEPRHIETPEAKRLREAIGAYLNRRQMSGKIAEITGWLYMAVVAPFREFTTRRGWALILVFVLLYKIGDAVAANQTSFFLFDMGFDEDEIALAVKIGAQVPLFIGIGLGGVLYFAAGAYRALIISGILMMATNLMFVWLSAVGHSIPLLVATMGFENFASGLGGTAVVAYLSGLCNKSFTATQYALLSAVTLLPRSIFAGFSGFLAEQVGWSEFFIFSTLVALPGIAMLILMRRIAFAADGSPVPHNDAAE